MLSKERYSFCYRGLKVLLNIRFHSQQQHVVFYNNNTLSYTTKLSYTTTTHCLIQQHIVFYNNNTLSYTTTTHCHTQQQHIVFFTSTIHCLKQQQHIVIHNNKTLSYTTTTTHCHIQQKHIVFYNNNT